MAWIPRGLRDGIVTTRYPRQHDGYGVRFRGAVGVGAEHCGASEFEAVVQSCPTSAISSRNGRVCLDRGCCILCGRCTYLCERVFQFGSTFETSAVRRNHLVVPQLDEDEDAVELARMELSTRVKLLRRSVFIRHVDAGSDGSEEWEVAALQNPIYDVQRLGIFFTASPKHADVLLVTGAGASGMIAPLRETFDVMPKPKVVVAVGVDAISGGLHGKGYSTHGGVTDIVPVDVLVPGSPPSPFGILHGIILAVGLLVPSVQGSKPR